MSNIIELAKQAGAVSYTNRHYPDRPYRTFGPEELQKFYTLARADLEAENAKLLAGVELPEYKYIDRHDVPKEGMCVYTKDQLQQYAAAAAAQAREKALDDAMLAVNSGVLGHGECADAIESLKGKP